jgi:hypothetical protein
VISHPAKKNKKGVKMDLTNVSFSTADALSVAVLVIGAYAVIWGAKAALSFTKK